MGHQTTVGVVENGNFQLLRWLFFRYFRDEASCIIHQYAVRRLLFSYPKMRDFE